MLGQGSATTVNARCETDWSYLAMMLDRKCCESQLWMQSCCVCDSLQVTVYERADRIGGLMMYGGECILRVTQVCTCPSSTPTVHGGMRSSPYPITSNAHLVIVHTLSIRTACMGYPFILDRSGHWALTHRLTLSLL